MIRELLEGKSREEKSRIKSQEVAKLNHVGTYDNAKFGVKVEIQSLKAIEVEGQSGVEIMARGWKGTKPLGFGDGSIEIERFRIFNPPILVYDPTGNIERFGEDGTSYKLKEDPIRAIRETLAHNVKLVGKTNAKIIKGKVGNTTSTFFPAAGSAEPVDGEVRSANGEVVWATIRDETGTTAVDTNANANVAKLETSTTSARWFSMTRGIFGFDTSAIPDTDTVDSATLSFDGNASTDNFTQSVVIDRRVPTSTSTLNAGDYNRTGWAQVEQSSTRISIGSWATGSYNDFTLNATGLGNLSKTGLSWYGTRLSGDFDNSEPTWASGSISNANAKFADTAGTASDPKLVVVHTGAVVTGYPPTLLTLGVG